MSVDSNIILKAQNVTKNFHDGVGKVEVLKGINFVAHRGEQIAIVGPSGSGKSTLLQILGGLEKPTSGTLEINGENVWSISEKRRAYLRNHVLGFVYQLHHLLQEFTALENVAMPLWLSEKKEDAVLDKASDLLTKVGLSHRKSHKPSQLSGGERQRVAIARAMAGNAQCILADEPTGNLDPKTAQNVYEVLLEVNQWANTCIILVTHDERLASRMQSTWLVQDGLLIQ